MQDRRFLSATSRSEGRGIASFRRITTITAALSAIGFVVGATLGAILVVGFLLAHGGHDPFRDADVAIPVSAIVSGAVGAVLVPVASWLLMRHVPIWRAIPHLAGPCPAAA